MSVASWIRIPRFSAVWLNVSSPFSLIAFLVITLVPPLPFNSIESAFNTVELIAAEVVWELVSDCSELFSVLRSVSITIPDPFWILIPSPPVPDKVRSPLSDFRCVFRIKRPLFFLPPFPPTPIMFWCWPPTIFVLKSLIPVLSFESILLVASPPQPFNWIVELLFNAIKSVLSRSMPIPSRILDPVPPLPSNWICLPETLKSLSLIRIPSAKRIMSPFPPWPLTSMSPLISKSLLIVSTPVTKEPPSPPAPSISKFPERLKCESLI